MTISALSQQGNPLHPSSEIASSAHETWRKTVRLAAQLGVPVVNAFSGCPGDSGNSVHPNWVTCAWPPEFLDLLDWQWNEIVTPYWAGEAALRRLARDPGRDRDAPRVCRLQPRRRCSSSERAPARTSACNFDPSHLFWQGIDPVEAISLLAQEGAIYHVHAKDTELHEADNQAKGRPRPDPARTRRRAVVVVPHDRPRPWPGGVASSSSARLPTADYDYVVSIEHEDERLDTTDAVDPLGRGPETDSCPTQQACPSGERPGEFP